VQNVAGGRLWGVVNDVERISASFDAWEGRGSVIRDQLTAVGDSDQHVCDVMAKYINFW